LNWQNI